MDSDLSQADICRVCRSEGMPDRPLFHPCICTGSIKWIHQECLMQWMRYSRKEYCELCSYRFSFTPIYSPDMPRRLPIRDLVAGLLTSIGTAIKYWVHYTIVAIAWLGIVPLSACRIYRTLFTGTWDAVLVLPFELFSLENLGQDVFQGCFVVTCTLFAFAGLVWLREQILHGGGPDWLQRGGGGNNNIENNNAPAPQVPLIDGEAGAPELNNLGPGNNEPAFENLEGRPAREAAPFVVPAPGNDNGNPVLPPRGGGEGDVLRPVLPRLPDLPEEQEPLLFNDEAQQQERNLAAQLPQNDRQNVVGEAQPQVPVQEAQPQIEPVVEPQHQPPPPPPPPIIREVPAEEPDGVAGGGLGELLANGGNGNANNNNDDNNWIPMEWDRAAEEITWERLLGLDGSLMFLEHVFWVISLNTLFICIFALVPYWMGRFTLYTINMSELASASHFEGLITTLVGYCTVGINFVFFHRLAGVIGFYKAKRVLGLCYVVVKVSMLSVVEIGILPLVCGWWLDICSLAMFDATLKDREQSFASAPGTSIFIHWLIGMVYVYYFASFVLLLREILRPGVLWFLRNFNDPDFSPIQEMIHLPILEHVRKLLISSVIFGSVVLLMLWLPIRLLKWLSPTFLPYTVSLSNDTQVNELSLELLLLQVILPALLEQSHTRIWLKGLVRNWCKVMAWILNLHSYLLGDNDGNFDNFNQPMRDHNHHQVPANENAQQQQQPVEEQQQGGGGGEGVGNVNAPPVFVPPAPLPEPQPELGAGLGAAHQALLMREPPSGFQPYDRPSFFVLRLTLLLISVCVSLVFFSLIALTLPVWLGRRVMALWLVGAPPPGPQIAATPVPAAVITTTQAAAASGGGSETAIAGAVAAAAASINPEVKVHELYTAACGLYLCWLMARAVTLVLGWMPQGRAAMIARLKQWCVVGLKTTVASIILLGLVPLLFGMLLELVVIVPLRVPIYQTPILFVWQDWALGVLYTKIACALTMMGPDWFLRAAIERIYRDGIRDMHLRFVFTQVAVPVITSLGLALAVPYVLAYSVVPLFITNLQMRNLIARRIYPFLLLLCICSVGVVLQIRQFKKLYEHIKNDKYLVGQRLVNYDHSRKSARSSTQPQQISN